MNEDDAQDEAVQRARGQGIALLPATAAARKMRSLHAPTLRARPVHAGLVVLAGGIIALGAATQQRPPDASEEEVMKEAVEGR